MDGTMGDRSLYNTDILAWSEQQAAALRGLEGRRDLPNALDLPNLVEEIEALGRSELRAATSPIRLILEHLVKLASAPEAPARAHWVGEILHWHADMQASISPSMHRRIDMDLLWRRGRSLAEESLRLHGDAPLPGLPASCPLRLEDFLAEEFDWQGAVSRIAAASGH
jgi:hypothetical protein